MPLYAFGPVPGTFLQDGERTVLLEHARQFSDDELRALAERAQEGVLSRHADDPDTLFELGVGYMENELIERHGFRRPLVAGLAVLRGPYASQQFIRGASSYPVVATLTMDIEAYSLESAQEQAEMLLDFGCRYMDRLPAVSGSHARSGVSGAVASVGTGVPTEYTKSG